MSSPIPGFSVYNGTVKYIDGATQNRSYLVSDQVSSGGGRTVIPLMSAYPKNDGFLYTTNISGNEVQSTKLEPSNG